MTEQELTRIFAEGENISIEFKKSTTDVTKDVYETVCSFSNRDGGHIFLGVRDDGTVLGVDPSCVDKIKKDIPIARDRMTSAIIHPERYNLFPPIEIEEE